MSIGILSFKLCELDAKIAHMHNRIQMCETFCPDQIHGEVRQLKAECKKNETTVRNSLERSRAKEASLLLNAYNKMEEVRRQTIRLLEKELSDKIDSIEYKILLAEYELDFVMLAANRALAVSMEAIEDQLRTQTEETGNV